MCERVIKKSQQLDLLLIRNIILSIAGSCCFLLIVYRGFRRKQIKRQINEFIHSSVRSDMMALRFSIEEKIDDLDITYDTPIKFVIDE